MPPTPSWSTPSRTVATTTSPPSWLKCRPDLGTGGSAAAAHEILHGRHHRKCVLPARRPVLWQAGGVPVVVDLGPVGVVELVNGEARLQRVVEPHVVDALVHRLLDHQ